MADPLAYVRPGISADGIVNNAERHNFYTDAARGFRKNRQGFSAEANLLALTENEFYIRNETGADRNRFDIVAFEEPVFLRSANESGFNERTQTYLKAIEPAWPDHFLSWGILQEACKQNKVGRVRVGGIAVALVNFADADATTGHKYATLKDATYDYLDSAPCGMARVLWRDTTAVSSTRYWCKLWLGGPIPTAFVGRSNGAISAASGSNFPYTYGTGTIDVGEETSTGVIDAGWNMSVKSTTPEIPTGKLLQGKFTNAGTPLIDVEPC